MIRKKWLIDSCFTPFQQYISHVTVAYKKSKIEFKHLHSRLTMVAPKTKLLRVIWTIIYISGSNDRSYIYEIHSCFVYVTLYSELFIHNPYKNVYIIYCITLIWYYSLAFNKFSLKKNPKCSMKMKEVVANEKNQTN